MMGHRNINHYDYCMCKYCYGNYVHSHRIKKQYSRLKRRTDKKELRKELKSL